MILMGDFNAHLDNSPDYFTEGHVSLITRFPELGRRRLGRYKDQANTAGTCLQNIALETPLILTTGRGKGDRGQPTFFGYNPPFNFSRTEHLLTDTLFCCTQNISVLHEFDTADHRPLLCLFSCQCSLPHLDLRLPGQIVKRGRGKHLIWRDEHKDVFVAHVTDNQTVQQSFREAVHNHESQSAYQCFLSLVTQAAEAASMTAKQMPHRMQLGLPMPPWFDATCREFKRLIRWNLRHNLPVADMRKEYSEYCRERKNN